jgi:alkylhydroperoxidase family enzyme
VDSAVTADSVRRVAEEPAPQRFDALRHAVLDYEGTVPADLRRAAFSGDEVPEVLTGYVEKVRRHAYKVTDEEVAALLAAGFSEDQVFELTVAVAAGAGFRRLDAGLRAIGG